MARMDEKFMNPRSRTGHLGRYVRPTAYRTMRNSAQTVGILCMDTDAIDMVSLRLEMNLAEAKQLVTELQQMITSAEENRG